MLICTGGHGTSARSALSPHGEEWHEGTTKTTIRADNEVEAHREANNYRVSQEQEGPLVTTVSKCDSESEMQTCMGVFLPFPLLCALNSDLDTYN